MQNCTFGRPLEGHEISDTESAIVEAVFKLREKMGNLQVAELVIAKTLDQAPLPVSVSSSLQKILDFLKCLATLEIQNQDTFQDIFEELKSYQDVPEP